METLSLVIADSDSDFLYKLSKYIMDKQLSFEVAIFSEQKSLLDYLKSTKSNILIVDEYFLSADNLKNISVDSKILMSVEKLENKKDGFNRIKKYQRLDNFINEIIDIYFNAEINAIMGGIELVNTKTVSFYSPSGGAGCTALSLSLAINTTVNKESAFYINFEKHNSSLSVLKPNKIISPNDIKSVLENETLSALEKMAEISTVDENTGVTFFPFPLTKERYFLHFNGLVNLIKNTQIFKYLILDFSTNFAEYENILKDIPKNFLIAKDDKYSAVKISQFLSENINLASKSKIILNFNKSGFEKHINKFKVDYFIEDSKDLRENESFKIKLQTFRGFFSEIEDSKENRSD